MNTVLSALSIRLRRPRSLTTPSHFMPEYINNLSLYLMPFFLPTVFFSFFFAFLPEKVTFGIWQVSTFELFRLCSHVSGNLHLKNSVWRRVVVFGPCGSVSFYILNDILGFFQVRMFLCNENKTCLAVDGQPALLSLPQRALENLQPWLV